MAMPWFRSYRARLQLAFVSIGLAAIAIIGWTVLGGASAALREATFNRLTAIRETKRLQIERYFRDVGSHVLALSSDESTSEALLRFREALSEISVRDPNGERELRLRSFYETEIAPAVANDLPMDRLMRDWFPRDITQQTLQDLFLASNPHSTGAKDLLVDAAGSGDYGRAHMRHHPTFHQYLNSFGFYDIFLIDARDGRVLYTVYKEMDLGASLRAFPWADTALAHVFEAALQVSDESPVAAEDYHPYVASQFAPAAFFAAPIRRAGNVIGVLAIQVSVAEVNRMIAADRGWRETGMGETGQVYIVGKDRRLRSDIRIELEQADAFFEQLKLAGVERARIEKIRRDETGVLTLEASDDMTPWIERGEAISGLGRDLKNVEVLRSFAPLHVDAMPWFVVAEIESAEAFASVAALRGRVLALAGVAALLLFVAAWFLARTVTEPIRSLAASTQRLAKGEFSTRLEVRTKDEIGALAGAFNRMAEELEQSTVSRSALDAANRQLRAQQKELEALAARLIRAQEDERSRIARELHDDLTQRLAAVAIELGKMERSSDASGKLAERARELRETMAQISVDVHRLSRSLHPSMLKELGLGTALEQEFRAFFERGGAPVHFVSSGDWEGVSDQVQLAIYRVVQEALQNALRHADASEVQVFLACEGGYVRMELSDDGRGFDEGSQRGKAGLGLASMRERVQLLGGTFEVRAAPGKGTTLLISLPVTNSRGDLSS